MPSICFLTLAHSFTPVEFRIQDERYRCLILESKQQVEQDCNMTGDDGVTYKLPDKRTIGVLFHACVVQKPILSLGCLAQQVYWSDFRADTSTMFIPEKMHAKHRQTQLHKEESLFFVIGTMVASLTAAEVSDEVAQELQMPMGPQMLEKIEERMPPRPATFSNPGTPDQIVIEQHNLTHFPSQPWCKVCVEYRGHDLPHREQSKIDAVMPQLHFDYGYLALYR